MSKTKGFLDPVGWKIAWVTEFCLGRSPMRVGGDEEFENFGLSKINIDENTMPQIFVDSVIYS